MLLDDRERTETFLYDGYDQVDQEISRGIFKAKLDNSVYRPIYAINTPLLAINSKTPTETNTK